MRSFGFFEKKPDLPSVRIKLLKYAFILAGLIIFARLLTWQVFRADQLTRLARSQHQASSVIPAQRGSILSSDDFPMASSKEVWLVWSSLPEIEDSASAASRIASILVDEGGEAVATESAIPQDRKRLVQAEEERIKKLLTKTDVSWVPLKHRVSNEVRSKIEKLNLRGVGFDKEEARSYPEGTMAAHLLGFVGSDAAGQDKGYFGLEGYYDLTLSGSRGQTSWEKDAYGNPILAGGVREIRALDGLNLKTHIDRSLQFIVERRLEEGLARYGANSGTVIIMRPQDGAILAMASLPSYDPARFSQSKEGFVNPAVGESFEPGSIFKPLIMAAALDSGVVKSDTRCSKCSGPRRIAEYTISTWDEKYFPDSTTAEIIQHSDNIGMVWVGEQLGKEKLYEYLQNFGIGSLTGIDLQDEATPSLRSKDSWGLIDVATASFGQGIAVTPIQMLRAVGAIANGGRIVVPQVVAKIIGPGFKEEIKPVLGAQVISEDAAKDMTQMMVNAVEKGEAKWTKLAGFQIAGKTGTAQIPIKGHYESEKTIASFIGFAPADKPRFVMFVTLREPKSSPWASETAAPLWFAMARDIFPYLGIHPK